MLGCQLRLANQYTSLDCPWDLYQIVLIVVTAIATAVPNGHLVGPDGPTPIRPVYPRTQCNTQYSSTPRVNAGDLSQPSSGKPVFFHTCVVHVHACLPPYLKCIPSLCHCLSQALDI